MGGDPNQGSESPPRHIVPRSNYNSGLSVTYYLDFTLMVFGFTLSAFGMVSVSSPLSNVASAFSAS